MNSLRLLTLGAVVLSGAAAEVIEITDNFSDTVNNGDVWLVEFYGPKCGFCKMFSPTYEKLADKVEEEDLGFKVAKANIFAEDIRPETRNLGVGKLPHLTLFRDGKFFTFPDARNIRAIDEYVEYVLEDYEDIEWEQEQKKIEEARALAEMEAKSKVVKLETDTYLDVLKQDSDPWFVEFYGPKCGYCKRFHPTWEELADDADEQGLNLHVAKVDATKNAAIARGFDGYPWPALKLLADGRVYTFPEPRDTSLTKERLLEWAQGGYLEEEESFVPSFADKLYATPATGHDEL